MSTTANDARRGLSRAVVWTGIALGTALAVLAVRDGAVLVLGGVPSWLGAVLGVLLMWTLISAASVAVAELVRRYHRTAARYAVRQGRRGGAAAARGARWHGGRLASAVTSRAGARWQRRDHSPLMFARTSRETPVPLQAPGTPAEAPPQRICSACGNPENGPRRGGGTWGPVVVWRDPDDGRDHFIHRVHFEDESTGFYGKPYTTSGGRQEAQKPAGEGNPEEGNGMARKIDFRNQYENFGPGDGGIGSMAGSPTGGSKITPGRRARGAAARTGGTMPAAWNTVIARTADFEPESDGDLLDWMGDEVAAVAAYAEALVDLYESLTQGTGLDPVAMTALHDVADAQAHASETMSGARRKFADHYDRPREFAAEGGLMPHDGRWVTGEGDA